MIRNSSKHTIEAALRKSAFSSREDRVYVYPDEDNDSIHVLVISTKFRGKHLGEKGEMIWSPLFESLAPEEWGRITLTRGLAPEEVNGLSLRELKQRTF